MLTPDNRYDVKGELIRNDILELCGLKPCKILSIGCGSSFTEKRLKDAGSEVWGIDYLPESIDIARQRIDHVFCGNLDTDSFPEIPENYFDLIIAGDIIEHLQYPEYVIKKIKKWMKTGGHIIISVPNSSHYAVIRSLLLERDWKYKDSGIFDEGHLRIFTRKSIIRLLEGAGFKIIALRPNYSSSAKIWVRILQSIMTKATSFGSDYFAIQWVIKAESLNT